MQQLCVLPLGSPARSHHILRLTLIAHIYMDWICTHACRRLRGFRTSPMQSCACLAPMQHLCVDQAHAPRPQHASQCVPAPAPGPGHGVAGVEQQRGVEGRGGGGGGQGGTGEGVHVAVCMWLHACGCMHVAVCMWLLFDVCPCMTIWICLHALLRMWDASMHSCRNDLCA